MVGEAWPGSSGCLISFQDAAICLHRCADMVYVGDIVVLLLAVLVEGECLVGLVVDVLLAVWCREVEARHKSETVGVGRSSLKKKEEQQNVQGFGLKGM